MDGHHARFRIYARLCTSCKVVCLHIHIFCAGFDVCSETISSFFSFFLSFVAVNVAVVGGGGPIGIY